MTHFSLRKSSALLLPTSQYMFELLQSSSFKYQQQNIYSTPPHLLKKSFSCHCLQKSIWLLQQVSFPTREISEVPVLQTLYFNSRWNITLPKLILCPKIYCIYGTTPSQHSSTRSRVIKLTEVWAVCVAGLQETGNDYHWILFPFLDCRMMISECHEHIFTNISLHPLGEQQKP